jgi:uncharacterized coiled-coil protein SlyX
MNDAVLALPFDQYQRYRLVADLLRELRGKGERLHVLDVGGRTAVLRDFLEDARIDLVDMEPSSSAGLVLGDGARLPFKDGAFDAVCAFDTLEHVPPAARRAFVAECRRVARRWVILAGPYSHPRVAEAEELLKRFLKDKLAVEHRYLDEHRSHGLPERAATEAQLEEAGGRILSIGHGNLERWLILQCLSMYLDYDASLRGVARDFQRWYNAELYASDHAQPCYRHVVVAAFGDAELPDPARLLAPPTAPSGALAPFAKLAPALLEFDAERARWRSERTAFESAVRDLSADLSGHRLFVSTAREQVARLEAELQRVCSAFESERAAFREVQHTLELDLEGHRKALAIAHDELEHLRVGGEHGAKLLDELAAVRAQLEQHVAEHARVVEDWRSVLADRERDLDGHRAALRDLNQDLAGHKSALANAQAEIEAHKHTEALLQADLAGHRAALANLERDLAGEHAARELVEQALERSDGDLRRTLQLASGLENSLAQREMVYDELRRELRSRWRNLLRVFRPLR